MTLPLHPETLERAYDFLRSTPPFNRYKLPPGHAVAFKVVRDRSTRGWYRYQDGKHVIAVSAGCVGHTTHLIETMAHEMAHACQRVSCTETPGAEHNAAFWKLAGRVCKFHGFDPKLF